MKENQIKEMAGELYHNFNRRVHYETAENMAEHLYDVGYRKANNSTEELLQEIENLKQKLEAQRFANKQLLKKHKEDRKALWNKCRIETAKEFAEKLKKEAVAVDYGCGAGAYDCIGVEDIDDVLEEYEKEKKI